MIREIVHIDKEKCNGCGLCAEACHEGAIGMVNGKAKLLRDDYCDGMGDCLPACPADAITIERRESDPYDKAAVEKRMAERAAQKKSGFTIETGEEKTEMQEEFHGCPGHRMMTFDRNDEPAQPSGGPAPVSELTQWPVQIKLVPYNAPYFDGAKLLIAADCTAYAYANFHKDFIRGKVTLVGCPKLDDIDYSEKLTYIIKENNIKEVTIVRMEVPCCGGLQHAAEKALQNSGKFIPWRVVTISTDGRILD